MKTTTGLLTLSLLFCCITSILEAQQPTFTKVYYDPSGTAQGYAVAKTADQKYVIAGERNNRALVMKIDQAGNILWSKKIGSLDGSRFNCLTGTHDSCIVTAGYNPNSINGASEIFCIKMTSSGDTLWTRTIDMGQPAVAMSVQETSDHGFILAGHMSLNVAPYSKIVVVKFDASGILVWSKIISAGNEPNYACAIRETTDGGFIISGELDTYSPFTASAILMKLTSSGAVSWTRKVIAGATDLLSGLDVAETNTGYLWMVSSADGTVILKTDFSGNFLSGQAHQIYNWAIFNGIPMPKLHPTSDHGYIFGSVAGWGGFNSMIKIDSAGNYLWAQTLTFIGVDVVESYDSGYLALGNGPVLGVIMAPTDHPQIGIIKTDSLGNGLDCIMPTSVGIAPYIASLTTVTSTTASDGALALSHPAVSETALSIFEGCVTVTGSVADNKPDGSDFRASPNPSNGLIQITLHQIDREPLSDLGIYNEMGEIVYQSSRPVFERLTVDLSCQPNGIYYIRGLIGGKISSQKMVICHGGK